MTAPKPSYSTMQYKKILAVLPPNHELQATASAKLYTAGTAGKEWLYSDLDGLLCFILDTYTRTRYLILYDSFSFAKLFQYELYNDFSKCFLILSEDFRCFEVENGFIGLQFDECNEAKQFDFTLDKLKGSLLKSLFDTVTFNKKNEGFNEKINTFYTILKEKFCSGDLYDEKYAEDGTEIIKARNFEMLNNISYNREKKNFEIGEISDELRDLFIASGVRKKDLQNDLDFAFKLFKQIIIGVSDNKELLDNDKFHRTFSPPENNEKGNEVAESATMPTAKTTDDDNTISNDNDNEPKYSSKSTSLQSNQTQKPITKPANTITNSVAPAKKSLAPSKQVVKPQAKPVNTANKPAVTTKPVSKPVSKPGAKPGAKPVSKPVAKPTGKSTAPKGVVPLPPPLPADFLTAFPTSNLINTVSETIASTMSKEEELAQMKLKKVEENEKPKELSMYDQIANMKLKAVKKDAPQKLITKNEQNYLQNSLAAAIQQRRQNLMKHQEDDNEDEDEDEDW